MKIRKRIIESAAVIIFALVMMVTVTTEKTEMNQGTTEQEVENIVENTIENIVEEQIQEDVVVKDKTEIGIVTTPEDEEVKVEEEVEVEVEVVVSEWADVLASNVEVSLNVRQEPSAESQVVGKMYRGAFATILERGEEWTKISSGDVVGYVKNEFCLFEDEVADMAKEFGKKYAIANVYGLRVREHAGYSEEIAIVSGMDKDQSFEVNTVIECPDEWVPVIYAEGKVGYVRQTMVEVKWDLPTAITIEEELELIRKAQVEAAEKKKQTLSGYCASLDDVTLLAALIQSEAGTESYEGKVAVGAVVMNRVKRGFGRSIYEVIFAPEQFTVVTDGALQYALSRPIPESCIQAAIDALNGVDPVNGAIFFRQLKSGCVGQVIGNHVFFHENQ